MIILILNCTVVENYINISNQEPFSEHYEVLIIVVA